MQWDDVLDVERKKHFKSYDKNSGRRELYSRTPRILHIDVSRMTTQLRK